jgi:hypothetical protein
VTLFSSVVISASCSLATKKEVFDVKSEIKIENTKPSNDEVDQPKEIAANVSKTETALSSEENISKDNPAQSSENNPLNKEATNDRSKVKVDREINEKSLVKDVIIEICLSNRNFKVRDDHNKKKSLEIPKG